MFSLIKIVFYCVFLWKIKCFSYLFINFLIKKIVDKPTETLGV